MALVFVEFFIGNDTNFVSDDFGFVGHVAVAVAGVDCARYFDDSILLQAVAKLLVQPREND